MLGDEALHGLWARSAATTPTAAVAARAGRCRQDFGDLDNLAVIAEARSYPDPYAIPITQRLGHVDDQFLGPDQMRDRRAHRGCGSAYLFHRFGKSGAVDLGPHVLGARVRHRRGLAADIRLGTGCSPVR